jgi:membrane-associated phospholipid phosphatase
MTWGQTVADAVWTYRLNDGSAPAPPPFEGVLGIAGAPAAIGAWRPTPTANAPGAGPQYASLTPWVLRRPSQFRPAPPNALTSAEYAADYNEIKVMGVYNGSGRTDDQSELVRFWAGNAFIDWDRIAVQVSAERSLSLSDNAHLFALLHVTMADAGIACWDAKYRYVYWRPVNAIREGDADNNPATDPDPAWIPWLDVQGGTPPHPEYPSGHSTVSGSAAAILASIFGDDTPVTVTSDVRPGTRSFPSFSAVTAEIADARVFGGIHFRVSCIRGNALGQAVAAYVMTHAMRPD